MVGYLNGRRFEIATRKFTVKMRVDYEEVGLMIVEWLKMWPNGGGGRGEGGCCGVVSTAINF
jgi:hypothetical protein